MDKKLADPKFQTGFEEEAQKLAIGEQLSRLRQEAGLTQAQVAKRIGTTASAISRYENAEYDRYELRTLQKIVRACGGRLELTLKPGPGTHRAALLKRSHRCSMIDVLAHVVLVCPSTVLKARKPYALECFLMLRTIPLLTS